MVFKSILKLFGISGQDDSTPPLTPQEAGLEVPDSLPPATPPMPRRVYVREEILDARCRIGGYRYRTKHAGVPAADYVDALLRGERVRDFAEKRTIVIRIDPRQWREADCTALVGANTLFELAAASAAHTAEEWAALIDAIRAAGAGIAMTHDVSLAHAGTAAAKPDLVFFDLAGQSFEAFEQQLKAFKVENGGTRIAVENVNGWAEQRFCLSLGADCLLGSFVDAKDDAAEAGAISQSRTIILEMLSLLRSDASPKELAEAAKRDPATSLKLLSMANSPMYGHSRELASIDQAIVTLGRETLYRWLTMALFRAGGDTPRMNALLEHALYRARLMELAGGQALSKRQCDELFLIGLLSYTDVLLDIPMRDVLGRMQVVEEVRDVLLKNEGALSPYLDLVLSLQRGDTERIIALSATLALGPERIAEIHTAALDWAAAMLDT